MSSAEKSSLGTIAALGVVSTIVVHVVGCWVSPGWWVHMASDNPALLVQSTGLGGAVVALLAVLIAIRIIPLRLGGIVVLAVSVICATCVGYFSWYRVPSGDQHWITFVFLFIPYFISAIISGKLAIQQPAQRTGPGVPDLPAKEEPTRQAPIEATQAGVTMDVKVLARYIIILGVIVMAFGSFQIVTNQEEKFDRSKSKPGPFGGRDDMSNYFDTDSRNREHEQNRKAATKVLIAGAIVGFVGVGVNAAGKKPGSHS